MDLSTVIKPEDVILDLAVPNKASLIGRLSSHAAARLGISDAAIRAALLAREELGSTGIGSSLAIPHAAIEGIGTPFAALAVLRRAIEFDAVDAQPVDIVFLLLTPPGASGDYLKILSTVARRTREDRVLGLLRAATSSGIAHAVLVEGEPSG